MDRKKLLAAEIVAWAVVGILAIVIAAGIFSREGKTALSVTYALVAALCIYRVVAKAFDKIFREAERVKWVLVASGPGDHMLALAEYEKLAKIGTVPVRLELPKVVNKNKRAWLAAVEGCDMVKIVAGRVPEEGLLFVAGAAFDANKDVEIVGTWEPVDTAGFFLAARDVYRKNTE